MLPAALPPGTTLVTAFVDSCIRKSVGSGMCGSGGSVARVSIV